MAFYVEWLKPDSKLGDPLHEAEVIAQFGGRRPGVRALDPARNAALYAKSVNGDRSRPPGEYLLFWRERLVRIDAYQLWTDAAETQVEYQVEGSTPADALLESDTRDVIKDGLMALARRHSVTSVDVRFNAGGRAHE